MRRYWSVGHRLPRCISAPLFGDRERFGTEVKDDDPDWQEWQAHYLDLYSHVQKQGVGKKVNDAGYRILRRLDLNGKRVMELGPGVLPHLGYWNGLPAHYTLVDEKEELLNRSHKILDQRGIPTTLCRSNSWQLPFPDGEFDIVLSFFCLEHVRPLPLYLKEMKRLLHPQGVLVGSIPAEGGLAWGLGRFVTSRRYVKRTTSINFNKILCWENKGFADAILCELERVFPSVLTQFWPLGIPCIDTNLVVSFLCKNDVGCT